MTDQHVKGAVSSTKGQIKEGVGKLTGDKELEARGDAQQLQGKVQQGLGDAQDAVRKVASDHD